MAKSRTDTLIRAHELAQAVTHAQRRATAEGRTFCVTRPPRGEQPLVEPLAGLELIGALIVECVEAGRALLVTPQGTYRGMSAAEIVAAESQ